MHRMLVLASLVVSFAHFGYAEEQREGGAQANPGAGRQPAAGQPVNLQVFGGSNVWGGGKSAAEWYIERTDKIVHLSDEQKQKIKEVIESRDRATREFRTSIQERAKSISSDMMEAYKSQDKEAIAKAQKVYQELYAPMFEITKKSEAALQDLLTAEQKSRLRDNQVTTMLAALAPGIELTEEQRREIRAEIERSAANHEAYERRLPQMIDKTLTAEQIATVLKHRATSYISMMFANAKLSPDQLKQVEAKVAELTREHKKTVNLDYSIYQKLSEHVNGLLSAEQKEAMKAQRAWVGGAGAGGFVVNPAQGGEAATPKTDRKPAERRVGEEAPSNVKVIQIPGGGIQVTIGERNEAKAENQPQQKLETLQLKLVEAVRQSQVSSKTAMRERVQRQRELSRKASKLMKKIDGLGENEKGKAHELWEELERVEGQLRQTFGPLQSSFAPRQPAATWVLQSTEPARGPTSPKSGAPLNPAPRSGQVGDALMIGVPGGAVPQSGTLAPGASLIPGAGAPNINSELQALRRQVEELRAQIQKLLEKQQQK